MLVGNTDINVKTVKGIEFDRESDMITIEYIYYSNGREQSSFARFGSKAFNLDKFILEVIDYLEDIKNKEIGKYKEVLNFISKI